MVVEELDKDLHRRGRKDSGREVGSSEVVVSVTTPPRARPRLALYLWACPDPRHGRPLD